MAGNKKTVFLHIGPFKTGTTSIQRSFATNRGALSKMDVCYPTEFTRGDAHFGLHDKFKWGSLDTSHLDGLGEMVASKDENVIVLSNEALSSKTTLYAPYPKLSVLWRAIDAQLSSFDVKIVAYCRRQDDSAESRYIQAVKGQGRHFDLKMDEVFDDASAVNLLTMAFELRAAFPKAKLIFRPFHRDYLNGGNVVRDFLSVLGVDPPEIDIQKDSNVTPSGAQIRMMQILNTPELQPVLKDDVKSMAWGYFAQEGEKASVFSAEQRQQVMDFYAQGNAEFIENFVASSDRQSFEAMFAAPPKTDDCNIHLEAGAILPFLKNPDDIVSEENKTGSILGPLASLGIGRKAAA